MTISDVISDIESNLNDAYLVLESKGATIPTEKNIVNLQSVISDLNVSNAKIGLIKSGIRAIYDSNDSNPNSVVVSAGSSTTFGTVYRFYDSNSGAYKRDFSRETSDYITLSYNSGGYGVGYGNYSDYGIQCMVQNDNNDKIILDAIQMLVKMASPGMKVKLFLFYVSRDNNNQTSYRFERGSFATGSYKTVTQAYCTTDLANTNTYNVEIVEVDPYGVPTKISIDWDIFSKYSVSSKPGYTVYTIAACITDAIY